MHPNKKVQGLARFVVHRLLTQMSQLNIRDLYAYARDTFLKLYLNWPVHKREWAIEFLKKYYVPRNPSSFSKTAQK
jgi:hypothetical protein